MAQAKKKQQGKLQTIAAKILQFTGSKKFFYIVLGLFFLQAGYLAFVSYYPMISDEGFHLGIIRVYSEQWSPFITSQSPEAANYGDLTRLTSYLHHYLLSFPYRIISSVIEQETIHVLALRFINISMVVAGLAVFRKLFLEMKFSSKAVHLSLFAVTMIPIFPLVAAQINYDNLLFLLLPVVLLFAHRTVSDKKNRLTNIALFFSTAFLASLTKFTFAPIFLAVFLYVAICLFRQWRKGVFKLNIKKEFSGWSTTKKVLLITLVVVSSLLFAERYLGNIVRYRHIDPDCAKIQPVSVCQEYYPWARNRKLDALNAPTAIDPVRYTLIIWLDHMSNNTFTSASNTSNNRIRGVPSPIILYLTGWFFLISSLVLILYYGREIFAKPGAKLLAAALAFYVLILWADRYFAYRRLSSTIAMQPRYLLIVIPIFLVFAAQAWGYALKGKQLLATAGIFMLLLISTQGGGFLTHLLYTDDTWVWKQEPIKQVNRKLHETAETFIIGR